MADFPNAAFNRFAFLNKEREKRLSRSSISDAGKVLEKIPFLLSRIIDEENESLDQSPTVLNFKNGNSYEGDVRNGKLHGKGKYKWENGTIYEGDFSENNMKGSGTYYWPNGSWYKGEVADGLRHGYGTYQCSDQKTRYTGEWVKGERHGKGKITYDTEGVSYYDGEWEHNKQFGMGTRQYSSGNLYDGQWKDGCRHGNGTMHWKDRGEQYSGEWVNGIQHGNGEHIWIIQHNDNSQFPSSNRYVGEWNNGIREGKGCYYYASGGYYEGQWANNKKQGQGKYTLPNGDVIEGIFHDDKFISQQKDSGFRPQTPLGSVIGDIDNEKNITEQFNLHVSVLLSDDSANTSVELKQVQYVILRYLTQLRKIYHFYSSLGPSYSFQNKLLKRIQFWQFVKDCELYRHSLTLAQIDILIQQAHSNIEQCQHSPTDKFLMREFLQCLVFIAHKIYNNPKTNLAHCFDKFIKLDCLPKACKIQGTYHSSIEISTTMVHYNVRCWDLYSSIPTQGKTSPTLRQFLLFLKDLIGKEITATEMVSGLITLQPLAMDSEGQEYNLELPMVYLEFLEGLLYYASSWNRINRQKKVIEETTIERRVDEIEENEKIKMEVGTAEEGTVVIVTSDKEDQENKADSDKVDAAEIQQTEESRDLDNWPDMIKEFFQRFIVI